MVTLKNILMLLPFVITSVASAGNASNATAWVPLLSTDKFTLLYQKNKIRTQDGKKLIWIMFDANEPDYNKAEGFYFQSFAQKVLVDCKQDTEQTLSSTYYSGKMATGAVVSNKEFGLSRSVQTIPPNTVMDALLRAVCK